MNVAEAIIQALVAEGVRISAGITGQSVGVIGDALISQPEIQMRYTRQERVAVDICDGYARATGIPGVVFTDAGPAAANTMAGIVNSYYDSIPVLFLAGANKRFELHRRYTKELPISDVFRSVTKWVSAIEDSSQVGPAIRRAFVHLRSGRPGPVVLKVPVDVASMPADDVHYEPISSRPQIRSAGDPESIEIAVRLLAAAERPYVYVGAGVLTSEASSELVVLANMLTLPVASTLNGKSAFPEDHPLSLGIGGFSQAAYSSFPATRCAQEADVVMTVGCGFKQHATRTPMSKSIKHIQIDVDPSELHKEQLADVAILGDAKLILQQMVESAKALVSPKRLKPRKKELLRIAELRQEWAAMCEPLLASDERPVNPFRVTRELSHLVDPAKTIVLHDSGSVRGSTCQHYPALTPRGFIGFGVASSLGWSLGAAIGVKVACPDKLVITVMGDEAVGETGLDLETAARTETPILVIVKNNRTDRDTKGGVSPKLAAIRAKEVANFCALAESLGVKAWFVDDPDKLSKALSEAIAHVKSGKPSLVEVVTKRVPTSLARLWN
jgi:thiamine pyrophosphate-dependent acetolactate synthase large subunit-like protein